MKDRQVDRLARALATSNSRRTLVGGLLGGVAVVMGASWRVPGTAARDDGHDGSHAGNGGVAGASANGGSVALEDVNSGGNAGNAIGVGNTVGGDVDVAGGSVGNGTDIGVDAPGGTGIADASGGNGNVAVDGGRDDHDDDRRFGSGEACPRSCNRDDRCAPCNSGFCNRNGFCADRR